MHDYRVIANRLRSAEMELQFAQRAFDGSSQARERYAHALHELELALRDAQRRERIVGSSPSLRG